MNVPNGNWEGMAHTKTSSYMVNRHRDLCCTTRKEEENWSMLNIKWYERNEETLDNRSQWVEYREENT